MDRRPPRGRALTWFAVGFLGLDGLLLLLAGLWSRSAAHLAAGAACLLAAGVVLLFWRRHLRTLDAIRDARQALAAEARELRELVRRPPPS